MVNSSGGGNASLKKDSGSNIAKRASRRIRMSKGKRARTHFGVFLSGEVTVCSIFYFLFLYFKEAHPSQFGEFGLVGVEHIAPRFETGERELHDTTLGLTLHDCIDCG